MSKNNHWTAKDIPDQSGKVAIVTGAARGIGAAAAKQIASFAAQTAAIAVYGRSSVWSRS